MVIAIDGYSSCGKSTVARSLAKALDFIYVDSGAMYRAVTLYFIENAVPLNDREKIVAALEDINISLNSGSGEQGIRVLLNGKDVSETIRQMPVSQLVSRVSAIREVREKLVALQKEMGKRQNIVMDGRDIGTVVFPDAGLKVFMTASPEVRARRRFKELQEKGLDVPFEEVYTNLLQRDREDTTRSESPLIRAPDALILDNSEMSPQEQLDWILDKVSIKRQETKNLPAGRPAARTGRQGKKDETKGRGW